MSSRLKKELAVLTGLVAVLIALLVMSHRRDDDEWHLWSIAGNKPTAAEGPGDGGGVVKLGQIASLLPSPDQQEHYMAVELDIEVAHQRDKDEVGGRLTQLRDATISFLADRTTDDLRSSKGLRTFKRDLLSRLEKVVPGRPLKAIYVTNLVMQ